MEAREIGREFIGNTVSVDVDGLRGVNFYTVSACYEVRYEDERGTYARTEFETVDSFEYPWSEIERDGGIAQVNADLREVYGADPFAN